MKKHAVLCLAVIFAGLSLILVNSASASPAMPSVPEFTIRAVAYPYDVPPATTSTTDLYTGKVTTTTVPGYHVENKTTEIRIANQPFTPYLIHENGADWTINLCYNIRLKGHFSQVWGYYRLYNGSEDGNLVQDYDSDYTIVPIDGYLRVKGEVDFQVEALIGYEHGVDTFPGVPGTPRVITGESSGWSDIQTIKLLESIEPPENSSSPASTSLQTPQFVTIIAGIIAVAVICVGSLVYVRKRIKTKASTLISRENLAITPSVSTQK